jgi:hypothetical protein
LKVAGRTPGTSTRSEIGAASAAFFGGGLSFFVGRLAIGES